MIHLVHTKTIYAYSTHKYRALDNLIVPWNLKLCYATLPDRRTGTTWVAVLSFGTNRVLATEHAHCMDSVSVKFVFTLCGHVGAVCLLGCVCVCVYMCVCERVWVCVVMTHT